MTKDEMHRRIDLAEQSGLPDVMLEEIGRVMHAIIDRLPTNEEAGA